MIGIGIGIGVSQGIAVSSGGATFSYLQMNGTTDRITLPSMTFTEVVMDFMVNSKGAFEKYWSLPLSASYFQVASDGTSDNWHASVTSLFLDEVLQTNNTVVMAIGVRGLTRSVLSVATTGVISIFANGTTSIAHGDIWDIKIKNGSTLLAHYDMTTGTVLDQSGNGNDATLTGGTFIV